MVRFESLWRVVRRGALCHVRCATSRGALCHSRDAPRYLARGVVASRRDVLVAMFAHQRHMLQFDRHEPMFNSTRCADGDFVRARAIRGVDGGNARATGEWWRGNAREG